MSCTVGEIFTPIFSFFKKIVLSITKISSLIEVRLCRHRRTEIDLGLQGPINKNRILEQSQVIF